LYGHVLAFGKACLPQPFVKRRDLRPQNRGRASEQQPYYRHRLLRTRRERPGCRAAEELDELASPHAGHWGSLPPWRRWLVCRMLNLPQIGWAGPWGRPELF